MKRIEGDQTRPDFFWLMRRGGGKGPDVKVAQCNIGLIRTTDLNRFARRAEAGSLRLLAFRVCACPAVVSIGAPSPKNTQIGDIKESMRCR